MSANEIRVKNAKFITASPSTHRGSFTSFPWARVVATKRPQSGIRCPSEARLAGIHQLHLAWSTCHLA
jgi:hypothetical protein